MTWLTTVELAKRLNTTERTAQRILFSSFRGKVWRGYQLVVEQTVSTSRGRPGYRILESSLPPELQKQEQPPEIPADQSMIQQAKALHRVMPIPATEIREKEVDNSPSSDPFNTLLFKKLLGKQNSTKTSLANYYKKQHQQTSFSA